MFIVRNSFSDMYPTTKTRFQPFPTVFQPFPTQPKKTKKKKIFIPQINFFEMVERKVLEEKLVAVHE